MAFAVTSGALASPASSQPTCGAALELARVCRHRGGRCGGSGGPARAAGQVTERPGQQPSSAAPGGRAQGELLVPASLWWRGLAEGRSRLACRARSLAPLQQKHHGCAVVEAAPLQRSVNERSRNPLSLGCRGPARGLGQEHARRILVGQHVPHAVRGQHDAGVGPRLQRPALDLRLAGDQPARTQPRPLGAGWRPAAGRGQQGRARAAP